MILKTKEWFVEKSRYRHGGKYDYSKVIFKRLSDYVVIICDKHGEFSQTPKQHIRGAGCIKCGIEKCAVSNRMSLEDFKSIAVSKHSGKYDYSKVEYKNANTPVTITCTIHGDFMQKPYSHIRSGNGCPKCGKIQQGLNRSIHGLDTNENIKYHSRWKKIMDRCYKEGSNNYENYGGRGISVSEEFKDPLTFIEYIKSLPKPIVSNNRISLDRINVNGNYERGNLRWANDLTQSLNRRDTGINNRLSGISTHKKTKKVTLRIHLGSFDSIEDAYEVKKVAMELLKDAFPERFY